jgi:mRNA-degrading endonuclease RelE of RelBE toxin-antitoxin system
MPAFTWKTRVGDYPIAYEIRDDQVIVYVVRVLDQKEIYRILGRMQRPTR